MLPSNGKKMAAAVLVALCLALFLAACGGGDSTSSSSDSTETTSSGSGSESASGKDPASVVKPYIAQPSPFPVVDKLKKLPKGATVAYMDCGTGICGLVYELLEGAAQTMGVKLTRIKAGSAANTVSAAFDSVVAQKPEAVIVTAINVELWKKQLEELQADEIPVVTTGITGIEELGVEAPQASNVSSELAGELMANYIPAEMNPEANLVIYEVPELPFSVITTEKFTEELGNVCPKCQTRTVPIPVAATGNTAPSMIVSDLQAHPETNLIVFASDETEVGLPAALASAGIEVESLGYSPSPTNLQYVKEGKETAVLAGDFPVLTWTLLDQAAREMTGQELTGPEGEGIPVNQFLTKKDINFDTSKGWTGYPDFAEKFSTLWGVGG